MDIRYKGQSIGCASLGYTAIPHQDFMQYHTLFKDDYDKGKYAIESILSSATSAKELMQNFGALTVIFGQAKHKDTNAAYLQNAAVSSGYIELALSTVLKYITGFEHISDVLQNDDAVQEFLNSPLAINILNFCTDSFLTAISDSGFYNKAKLNSDFVYLSSRNKQSMDLLNENTNFVADILGQDNFDQCLNAPYFLYCVADSQAHRDTVYANSNLTSFLGRNVTSKSFPLTSSSQRNSIGGYTWIKQVYTSNVSTSYAYGLYNAGSSTTTSKNNKPSSGGSQSSYLYIDRFARDFYASTSLSSGTLTVYYISCTGTK